MKLTVVGVNLLYTKEIKKMTDSNVELKESFEDIKIGESKVVYKDESSDTTATRVSRDEYIVTHADYAKLKKKEDEDEKQPLSFEDIASLFK